MSVEITKPTVKKGLNNYSYSFEDLNVRVDVDRLTDDGRAEVSFWHVNGAGPELFSVNELNLLSTTMIASQVKRLKPKYDIDWDTVLTYITALTLRDMRQGEPREWIGKQPATMKLEYQLWPILQYKQPTTIYSPGGYFKSYLAIYIACLVQFGWAGFPQPGKRWAARKGNVLYLDWEDTKEDMERRVWAVKQGMSEYYPLDPATVFAYRNCKRPLYDDIPYIQQMVKDNGIEFVIVDSQQAATGTGPSESQLASQYYNALRSLNCTSLTLDHMNKAEISGSIESAGPYGSIVKFNRSRTQFQLEKSQNAGDDFLELSLVNKKNNNTRVLLPIGLHIDFKGNDDTLEMVKFSACNVADNPKLEKTAPLKDRLVKGLAEGRKTIKDLRDLTGKSDGTIRMELNRWPDLFRNTGEKETGTRWEYWEIKGGSFV